MHGRPTFSSAAAPIGRPLPLWILYAPFFIAVYLSHWPLLRLPFFWDEAGYYIPAALDFFRTGSLIPYSTLTNAHPPLPSILLAMWWHLSGYSVSGTRTFLCMIAAAALLGVFRLVRLITGTSAALAVTALTALYPVWFTQSTLAHADLFAAAFTLWALSFYFERLASAAIPHRETIRPPVLVAILFSLAALSKETAIVTPLALALLEAVLLFRSRPLLEPRSRTIWLTALLAPILPLGLWYLFHFLHTGFVFGNPEFLRYNATANLSATRVLASLWHRLVHLTVHMGLAVPVFTALALGLRSPLLSRSQPKLPAAILLPLSVVLLANAVAFSILGGALLTRYLLPLYPLVLLLCVTVWRGCLRSWGWLAVVSVAAFLLALFINPPYSFAPEDNLAYRDMILLHQQAIATIATRFPQATVLSAWPATAELRSPELGYTPQPIRSIPLNNFSQEEIEKAAVLPVAYDTALVFSTKWTPQGSRFNFGRASERNDRRFFDLHDDLKPVEIATLLHGQIVWQNSRKGEWAAVLRFPRLSQTVVLAPPTTREQGK